MNDTISLFRFPLRFKIKTAHIFTDFPHQLSSFNFAFHRLESFVDIIENFQFVSSYRVSQHGTSLKKCFFSTALCENNSETAEDQQCYLEWFHLSFSFNIFSVVYFLLHLIIYLLVQYLQRFVPTCSVNFWKPAVCKSSWSVSGSQNVCIVFNIVAKTFSSVRIKFVPDKIFVSLRYNLYHFRYS